MREWKGERECILHTVSSFIDYHSLDSKSHTYYICIHRDGQLAILFHFDLIQTISRSLSLELHARTTPHATHSFAALSCPIGNTYCWVCVHVCVCCLCTEIPPNFEAVCAAVFKTKNIESTNMCVEICWNVCVHRIFSLVRWCVVCVCAWLVYVYDELRHIQYMLHSSLAVAASRFGPQMHRHVSVSVYLYITHTV